MREQIQEIGRALLVDLHPRVAAEGERLSVLDKALPVVRADSNDDRVRLLGADHGWILLHPVEYIGARQAGSRAEGFNHANILVARGLPEKHITQAYSHHGIADQRDDPRLALSRRRQRRERSRSRKARYHRNTRWDRFCSSQTRDVRRIETRRGRPGCSD